MGAVNQNNSGENDQTLENRVVELEKTNEELRAEVKAMSQSLDEAKAELKELAERFSVMMSEHANSNLLEQAVSELERVRTEIDDQFGDYNLTRELMIEILKASDMDEIREKTVSRVTRDLMKSTKDYWLAPCLVAVAAWIDDDRELAEKAIARAVKRNEAKTALTMALICRRNHRIDTCYEWLALYFSKLKANDFAEENFVYIDAYENGIFGSDKKHRCDAYIQGWLEEIRICSAAFEKEQEQTWKEYFMTFKVDISDKFPELKKAAPDDFDKINNYVGRILSYEKVKNYFNYVMNADLDLPALRASLDRNLLAIVSEYESVEEPLREDEEYWMAVSRYHGDTSIAAREQEERRKKKEAAGGKRMNLAQQMTNIIIDSNDNVSTRKKTAITFMKDSISNGFNKYIEEGKNSFPNGITINVNGWTGKTVDGLNGEQLCADYDRYISGKEDAEVLDANNDKPKYFMIAAIVAAVLMIIGFIFQPFVGIALLVVTLVLVFLIFKSRKDTEKTHIEIKTRYEQNNGDGKAQIMAIADQWKEARILAKDFGREPSHDIF